MLQGTLNDFTLADVFSLLALTKKTGALRITSQATDGQVLFRDGLICLALSDANRVPLAARLVSAGMVDEAQVRSIVEQHSGSAVAVTEALLASGAVEDRVLALYLREQIVDAVFELSRLKEGSFNFDASVPPLTRGVGLSVVDVVGEATRRLEEWQSIGEHIASPHAVLAMVPSAAGTRDGVTLLPEQWELIALVDGRRTVSEVVELTGRGEFATCRVLGDLVAAGLVQAAEGDEKTDLDKLIAAREALRALERVEKSGIAPNLSSAAPLTPGSSRMRWIESPADTAPAAAARPTVLPSRTRMAEVPRGDEAVAKPAPVEPAATPAPAAPTPVAAVTAAPKAEETAKPQAASAEPAKADAAKPEAEKDEALAEAPKVERTADVAAPTVEVKRDTAPVASPSGVDRAQVARELASLGIDDASAGSPGPLTRDGDVNKGLLLRLIDGVKGA